MISPGIGMPAALKLDDFGYHVRSAFGDWPFLVGSALAGKAWRDVDVRLILRDEQYEASGFGDPVRPQQNPKWVAMVLAFSAFGSQMTGLPIDFQIQQMSLANAEEKGPRSALGTLQWLRTRSDHD